MYFSNLLVSFYVGLTLEEKGVVFCICMGSIINWRYFLVAILLSDMKKSSSSGWEVVRVKMEIV